MNQNIYDGNKFDIGEVVFLKCGSCPMCINDIETEDMDTKEGKKSIYVYQCIWTDTRGRMQEAAIREYNLTDECPACDEPDEEGHICPECDGHGGCCRDDEDELRN